MNGVVKVINIKVLCSVQTQWVIDVICNQKNATDVEKLDRVGSNYTVQSSKGSPASQTLFKNSR